MRKKLSELNISKDGKKVKNYFAFGMKTICPILPENVIAWISSRDSTFDRTLTHQRMILKVILKGEILSYVNGLPIPMKAGEAILLFPHQFHSTKNINADRQYEYLAVSFLEREYNYTPLFPLKNRVLQISRLDEKRLIKIISAFQQIDSTTPSEAVCALQGIFIDHLETAKNLPEPHIEIHSNDKFQAICNYICKNFTSQISLKTIADEFHVTPHTIRRMFHKYYTGITPGELIRRLRLQYAIELVLRSSDSIANIAEQCGYTDQFIFSRAFKKATGMPPQAYRKRYNHPG
jgi:AraC-like DNA-binding protein